MKKITTTLFIAFCLMITHTVNAQVKFGIVGGLDLTKVSYNKLPDMSSDNRAGWFIGPKVEFTVPVVGIGIDAALEYSQRRMNNNTGIYNGETTASAEEITTSKYYRSIEIPINLRYQIGFQSIAAVYFVTGPQFGFQVGNKDWYVVDQTSFEWKKSNVSWNFGAGVKLINHIEVGVGYNLALTKFAKFTGVGSDDASFKANSWQIQMAYLF